MYIRTDELLGACRAGRLRTALDGSRIIAIQSFPGTWSLSGFTRAVVTRCGIGDRIPESLRDAFEAIMTQQILHRGPPTEHRVVFHEPSRIWSEVVIGNWVYVRNRFAKAVFNAIKVGLVTDLEWYRPVFKVIGFDVETGALYFEYCGEGRRA
jgi:hypothetical protein